MIDRIAASSADSLELEKLAIDPKYLDDDFWDYSKVVVKKPWGYEYLLFGNESVAVWILYIKHGAQTSMHCHPKKRTSLVVLQGTAVCSTLNEDHALGVGDGLFFERKVFHQTKSTSAQGTFVMEAESPVNKRDLVRLKDRYGREGLGYETSENYSVNTQNYNYISLQGPEVHHNQKKQFGECSLTFTRVAEVKDLLALERQGGNTALTVLRGQILDSRSQVVAETGDSLHAAELRQKAGLRIGRSLELLVIQPADTMVKISDIVARFIKAQKSALAFVVPGDANVHLLDSVGREEGLRFNVGQSESGAALAAEAYAKLTGEISFVIISAGASATNVLTAVADAWVDSTPLFVISGQARSDQDACPNVRQLGNKALDIISMVKPITKYAAKVTDPLLVRKHLHDAARIAKDGRPGPVWLDLPIDIQGMAIDEKDLVGDALPVVKPQRSIAPEVAQVIDLLKAAKRPVLLAGSGLRVAHAEAELLKLIETLNIPVLTSRRGADLLPESHPLFFGRPGMCGQRRANLIIQNADLLISVGARLSIPLIGRNTAAFARNARKVIVDIDPHELHKPTVNADLPIRVDAGDFTRALLSAVSPGMFAGAEWLSYCQMVSQRFSPEAEGYQHQQAINPYLFLTALAEALGERACLAVDGGFVNYYTMQIFRFKPHQRCICSPGLDALGFAVPAALGAGLAGGYNPVVGLCDDHGFRLGTHVLPTIAQDGVPAKFFVFNSRGHAGLRTIQKNYFGARYVATDREMLFDAARPIDIAKLYGIPGIVVDRPEGLSAAIAEVLGAAGPRICEVVVDQDQELIPRTDFIVKDDGKWIARPLEDMYPLLGRDVLKQTMLTELFDEE